MESWNERGSPKIKSGVPETVSEVDTSGVSSTEADCVSFCSDEVGDMLSDSGAS